MKHWKENPWGQYPENLRKLFGGEHPHQKKHVPRAENIAFKIMQNIAQQDNPKKRIIARFPKNIGPAGTPLYEVIPPAPICYYNSTSGRPIEAKTGGLYEYRTKGGELICSLTKTYAHSSYLPRVPSIFDGSPSIGYGHPCWKYHVPCEHPEHAYLTRICTDHERAKNLIQLSTLHEDPNATYWYFALTCPTDLQRREDLSRHI